MAGFTSLALLLLVGALALGAFASPVHVRVSEEAISLNAPERTVAFRGSGFLINYYAGVTQTLILKGLLMATSPVSGQSGGAIIAVLHAAGFTPSQVLGFFGELYTACSVRYEGCHNGFVNLFVEESLQKYLPSNIAEILNAKNVKIGLSQVNSSNVHLGGSAPWVVSKYLNKADVISALLGSAHIPFGTAPSAFKIFRNNPVIDGTYAIDYEQLCPWGNTTTPKCLKIAAVHLGPLADETCNPASCPVFASVGCTLPVRTDPIPTKLYPTSSLFVDEWPISSIQNKGGKAWKNLTPLYPLPGGVGVDPLPDIYPGKYLPLPLFEGVQVTGCQWKEWSFFLHPLKASAIVTTMFQQGVADAAAWAAANGY